ncbi:MAG TPA: hypothetical protein VK988_20130 [Acidimicrobiales bacterium]|nr:hypothetical protein [Acidimicrobiales bacterium]
MDPRLRGLVHEFFAGLDAAGLSYRLCPTRREANGWDLTGDIEGVPVVVQVKSSASTAEASAVPLTDPTGAYPILVARRVSNAARRVLEERHIGFFDGRGHVRLWHRPLLVDTDVPAGMVTDDSLRPARLDVPAMLDVALAVLDGHGANGVRAAAARLGRAPGTVSKHLAMLRSSYLVSEDAQPVVPDLFEAVLDVWRPLRVPLAGKPRPGKGPVNQRLQLGFEDTTGPGWTLADATAAAAWGAPVALGSDAPPDFYVPDESTLRQARTLLGDARYGRHACTVAVAPSPFVCRNRYDRSGVFNDPFLAPSPVVAALDLAADPGRGRETLDLWSRDLPPEVHRVW